jgi:hypothetical protein
VDLFGRQERGEARDVLRTDLATQWVQLDREAAVAWMKSLDDDERAHSAKVAVDALRPYAPDQAVLVADLLGVGRDKGRQERIGAQN